MKFNSCLLLCILAFLLASCGDDPKKPSASADQMTTVIADMMQTTTPDQKMTEPDQEIKDMDLVVGDQAVADAQIVDMNTANFTACADGVDNDTDGLIDLFDTDCVNNQDTTEDQTTSSAKCLNGLDDDTDGLIDFPSDIGCAGAGDDDESDPLSAPLCANGQDDDNDGKTDFPNDPGCSGIGDLDETDSPVPPLCANGQDDDGDGLIDFPADGTCVSAGAWSESISCAQRDVLDLNALTSANGYYDGDLSTLGESQMQGTCGGGAGPEQIFVWRATRPFKKVTFNTIYEQTSKPVVVYVRSACTSTTDLACDRGSSETTGTSVTVSNIDAGLFYVFVDTSSQTAGPGTFRISVDTTEAEACRDTVDNDQDGVTDLLDPGCESEFDIDESNPANLPQCGDQLDNDNDGATDYPSDSDCSAAGDPKEGPLCAINYNNNFTVPAGGGTVTVPFSPNFNTSATDGCRENTGPESVAVITLDEASTIQVSFTETTAPFSAYLRAVCDSTTQIACIPNANTALSTDVLSAGTYFLYIDYNTANATPASNPEIQVIITAQVTECNDQQDNDGDQLIDLFDPGCASNKDDSEINGQDLPACADGIDNDEDGAIDYPNDAQCSAAGQVSENISCTGVDELPILGMDGGAVTIDTSINQDRFAPNQCSRGDGPDYPVALILSSPASVVARTSSIMSSIDTILYVRKDSCDDQNAELDCNDDYGFDFESRFSELSFDRLEPGVYYFIVDGYGATDAGSITLNVEVTPLTIAVSQCNDEQDNDGDNLIDSLDVGCSSFQDNDETNPATLPACADGVDNDQDNAIDFPADTDCLFLGDANEDPRCAQYESIDLVETQITVFPEGNANESMTLGCGTTLGYPSIISFEVTELSDVNINITGDNGSVDFVDRYLAVRSVCDDVMSEKSCGLVADGDSKKTYLLPAGRYYAIIGRAEIADRENLNVTFTYTSRVTECNDSIDNDADQKIDLLDPGCIDGNSRSEIDPDVAPICADGLDNDNDNNIDYPADSNCTGAGGAYEASLCNDFTAIYVSGQGGEFRFEPIDGQSATDSTCSFGTGDEAVFAVQISELSDIILNVTEDNGSIARVYRSLRSTCDDLDSEIDCLSSFDNATSFTNLEAGIYYLFVERSEFSTPNPFNVSITIRSLITSCNDEIDNDADDKIDRADPGCSSDFDEDETDPAELPACADGIDNDEDLLIDYPQDTQCNRAAQNQETASCDQATIEQSFYQDPNNMDLVMTFSAMVSTLGGSNQYTATCGSNASSPEKVIALNLTSRSNVVIETSGASGTFDTVIHARKTFCDDSSAQIGCDDDGADAPRMSKLSLNALEAGNYFIFVDGFGASNSGTVTVNITATRLVVPTTQCNDGMDNDGDMLVDDLDPGCGSFQDNDEVDLAVAPACADGLDNDEDGDIDYPSDADCLFAGDATEDLRCATLESVDLIGDRIEVMPEPNADVSIPASCGTPIGQPSIVAFDVPEISDVTITVKNTNAMATLANRVLFVRRACDETSTELSCQLMNSTSVTNLSLLPRGRYYAFIGRTSTEDRQPLTVTFTFTSRVTQCNDEIDNDGDQLIDLMDTGCITGQSTSENDPAVTPICADGLDNDNDGNTDYPQDLECTGAGGLYEASLCTGFDAVFVNGVGGTYRFEPVDNQSASEPTCVSSFSDTGDEAVFAVQLTELSNIIINVTNDDGSSTYVYRSLRTVCDDVTTEEYCLDNFDEADRFEGLSAGIYYLFVERADYSAANPFNVAITIDSLVKACNDGVDNDGDNRIDQFDAGCATSTDDDETDGQTLPECADGLDNDMDGDVDFPDDLECTRAGQAQEQPSCNLAPIAETLIQESRIITLNTATQMNNYTSSGCGSSARSPEQVFAVVLHEPSNIVATVTAAASGYDTVMFVRKDNCDLAAAELRCDDDGAGLPLSKITLNRMDPGIYYFFIDGYSTDNSGEATIDVQVTPLMMP